MKKTLIIQLRPEDDTADDEYRAILDITELPVDRIDRVRAERELLSEVKPQKYAALIVGGSPFDISTPDDKKTKLQINIENDMNKILSVVVEEDIPFLGACSGNGLLGNFCGVSISSKYSEPVGGVDIHLTDEGKRDKLTSGFPDTFRALVGHKEACDETPSIATLLASSENCPVEMFRIKNNVYATQFHPEADGAVFKTRILAYKHHGYFDPKDAQHLIKTVENEQTPYAKEILKRFAQQYCF